MKNIIPSLAITLLVITIIVYFELNSIPVGAIVATLVGGLSIRPLYLGIIDLVENNIWKASQRKLENSGKLGRETKIRISFAYLFRIKINGKYFLVPNTRSGKYQPVGGAYKFTKTESYYLRDNIPVENDDCIPVDEMTKLDYRLLVKNKDLKAFLKRFDKTQYRENIPDLSREFIEEIFTSGILNRNGFGDLSYKYCGRHMTDIEETVFKPFEMLLADIVEVQLTDKQEELFRKLMNNDSLKYRFATRNEIRSLGVKIGTNELADDIATHTYKILSENTDKLMMKNKHKETIAVSL